MAILAGNHRAPARSSPGDGGAAAPGPPAPPPRQRSAPKIEHDTDAVFVEAAELLDKGMEPFQVGDTVTSFPFELCELPDLKEVLSLETWNFYLSEEERDGLMALLPPDMDQASFAATLKDLLSGSANFSFGNPMAQFFASMKGGLMQPSVVRYRDGIRCLQRKEHYQLLRKYHNSMVGSFVEMQKLWDEYPDVEIEGRLEIWRQWKDTRVKPQLPKAAETKSFKTVHKAKKVAAPLPPPLEKNGMKKAAKGLKVSSVPLLKTGKAAARVAAGGAAAAKRTMVVVPVKLETAASSASDPDTLGNDRTGVSSSLTSGEKKRKASLERSGGGAANKRSREEESTTSSDDSEKKASSAGKQKTQALVDVGVAILDPIGDGKPKRVEKEAAPPETSSPPQSKAIRKLGVTFPFSIILFLSAIRRALLTPSKEGGGGAAGQAEASAAAAAAAAANPPSPADDTGSDDCATAGLFCVPFAEVVSRVQEQPGDPKVLETHEPVQDLVWGALKVLSSRVAPAGAKGWKPLSTYEKESKSWYWIGPPGSVDESGTSILADDWGVPPKILAKLEEAFATWYKHGEETRQQMVQLQLPPPPVASVAVDERERFRDMRAQKSLITIAPSSEDMRAYFRKEEILRYSVPDRAFAYTRSDGRKSVVAPLRRGGGKPNSKARDHSMLKPDRPPHVTILCLVRDAAARLPGAVGTRADVCALLRDSQFVVEEVTDGQVHQVVSGALDRLHYERDPCVRYDGERKLWQYLHTDRSEEDFEDDGTSSTKRWKKHKKEGGVEGGGGGGGGGGEMPSGGCYENGSPGSGGSGGSGGGGGGGVYGMELRLAEGGTSAIYSVGRTELVYSKSGSLSSPRVLSNSSNSGGGGGGLAEEPAMPPPYMELPPPASRQIRAPWEAPPPQQQQHQTHRQEVAADPAAGREVVAAPSQEQAELDADSMINGDGE